MTIDGARGKFRHHRVLLGLRREAIWDVPVACGIVQALAGTESGTGGDANV